MIIEILKFSTLPKYKPAALTPKKKQKRKHEENDASNNESDSTRYDIDSLTSRITTLMQKQNGKNATISSCKSGRDESGLWIMFPVFCPQPRFDLSFILDFLVQQNEIPIKDLKIRIYPSLNIFIRIYSQNERRIVSEWSVVPVYQESGMFSVMRSTRSQK